MADTLLSPPASEAPPTRPPATHTIPARVRGWAVAAMLLLFVAAFGGGVLTGKAMESDPIGLADDAVVELLDQNAQAINARDTQALAATYAEDAVVTDLIAGDEFVGAEEIASNYASVAGFELERTSEVLQHGKYAASTFTYFRGSGVTVLEIQAGKIAHQWIIGT